MKAPIFSQQQRNSFLVPELEVAKLKFCREFEKSKYYKFLEKIVDFLAKKIN